MVTLMPLRTGNPLGCAVAGNATGPLLNFDKFEWSSEFCYRSCVWVLASHPCGSILHALRRGGGPVVEVEGPDWSWPWIHTV